MHTDTEYHSKKAQELISEYPQIRDLYGAFPISLLPILLLISIQWLIAFSLVGQSILAVFIASFFMGQFIFHSLSTFVHETSHQLVLKGKNSSLFVLWLIELGLLSWGISYKYYLAHGGCHHSHLNEYEHDNELLDQSEVVFLTENTIWRYKEVVLSILPGGIFLIAQLRSLFITSDNQRKLKPKSKNGAFSNIILLSNALIHTLLLYFVGWQASLYFFWSLSIIFGYWGISFHGQNIREHNIEGRGLSYSSYGWSNFLLFNSGYHDEHHTFPKIAWIHLPKLRAAAKDKFNDSGSRNLLQWWLIWARSGFLPAYTNRAISESALNSAE
jgi:sphingolipid delta-4 desaturase